MSSKYGSKVKSVSGVTSGATPGATSGATSIAISEFINRFPFCEPSYSIFSHKKVSGDFYMAIPMGKKYLAWFTYYKKQAVCIFIQVEERDGAFALKSAFIRPCCFHSDLAQGTILYGTLVKNKMFVTEDIFHYRTKDCANYKPLNKLLILQKIFTKSIKQVDLVYNNIVFSLCIMNESYKLLNEELNHLDYKIYSIKTLQFNTKKEFAMKYQNREIETVVWEVGAEVETDKYNLYGVNRKTNTLEYIETAYIPNYKTSVFMNSIFRNIKENDNLDAIEESEDEDEFENKDNPEYFVDLEKRVKIECEYNEYFKGWVPIRLSKPGIPVSSF